MFETIKTNKSILYYLLFIVLIAFAFILTRDQMDISCKDGSQPVRLSMVGDLLIGSGAVWKQIEKDDYTPEIVGDYLSIFKETDFVFANFEGIITEQKEAREKGLPASYSLKTNPEILKFFKNFGNVTLSFANNHSADFGQNAIEDTLSLLPKDDVAYVGVGSSIEEALASHIVEKSGVRIAFIALTDLLPQAYYATSTNIGVAELTADNLQKAIALAKESADFVIVSLHTAEREESPFSFWPDSHQIFFSRLAIDEGADLVVGHHPHGLQLAEMYHGKPIFYSLGVFLYNPAVSTRYPPSHRLFEGIQMKGGGVLDLKICSDYVAHFNLFPTKVVYRNNNLVVVPSYSPVWLSAMFPHLSHLVLNVDSILSNSLSEIRSVFIQTF